jgi:hypothetical protein
MSYGLSFPNMFRRSFADKVLRGYNPAEIPVEQPTKFELVVNLTTAKALGRDYLPVRIRFLMRNSSMLPLQNEKRTPFGFCTVRNLRKRNSTELSQ